MEYFLPVSVSFLPRLAPPISLSLSHLHDAAYNHRDLLSAAWQILPGPCCEEAIRPYSLPPSFVSFRSPFSLLLPLLLHLADMIFVSRRVRAFFSKRQISARHVQRNVLICDLVNFSLPRSFLEIRRWPLESGETRARRNERLWRRISPGGGNAATFTIPAITSLSSLPPAYRLDPISRSSSKANLALAFASASNQKTKQISKGCALLRGRGIESASPKLSDRQRRSGRGRERAVSNFYRENVPRT